MQSNKSLSVLSGYVPVLMMGAFMAVALFAPDCWAGDGGAEFEDVWTTLKDWTQGTLGRIIAGAIVLVGIVFGVARQSLLAFAIGIGGGIGLYQAPNVIESILTVTVTNAEQMQALMPVINFLQ